MYEDPPYDFDRMHGALLIKPSAIGATRHNTASQAKFSICSCACLFSTHTHPRMAGLNSVVVQDIHASSLTSGRLDLAV